LDLKQLTQQKVCETMKKKQLIELKVENRRINNIMESEG
jgi:hypothetical protein